MLKHLNLRNDPAIESFFYDFHNVLGGDNFDQISSFRSHIEPKVMSTDFRFFIHSRAKGNTYYQNGVVRTNCLDCLDRTNFTQAHISDLVLDAMLNRLKVLVQCNEPNVQ